MESLQAISDSLSRLCSINQTHPLHQSSAHCCIHLSALIKSSSGEFLFGISVCTESCICAECSLIILCSHINKSINSSTWFGRLECNERWPRRGRDVLFWGRHMSNTLFSRWTIDLASIHGSSHTGSSEVQLTAWKTPRLQHLCVSVCAYFYF